MNKKFVNVVKYGLILRLGLGFVFIWFGIDKLINPINWLGYIPPKVAQLIFINLDSFIFLLGIVELILGTLLIIGLYTRIVAFIMAIHLALVVASLGFNEIAARDIGLLSIALYLSLTNWNTPPKRNRFKNRERNILLWKKKRLD